MLLICIYYSNADQYLVVTIIVCNSKYVGLCYNLFSFGFFFLYILVIIVMAIANVKEKGPVLVAIELIITGLIVAKKGLNFTAFVK